VIGRLSDDVGPRRTVVRTCKCMARCLHGTCCSYIFQSVCYSVYAHLPTFQRYNGIDQKWRMFLYPTCIKIKDPVWGTLYMWENGAIPCNMHACNLYTWRNGAIPDNGKILMIYQAVSTEYHRACDGRPDRQTYSRDALCIIRAMQID